MWVLQHNFGEAVIAHEKESKARTMSTHVKGYLQETTVHGFRYVVEGRTVPERLAWVVAILLAFAYASILVHSAMREAEDNPVSTAIEIGGNLSGIAMYR